MKNFTRYRIIEFLELIGGSVLPIVFWVSLIFGFDTPYIAVLTLACALIHEIGHIVAIHCFVSSAPSLTGHTTGFRIRISESLSYKKEIAILLAGPGINILTYLLTVPFGNALYGYIKTLGYVSLATGISNLLPIEGYDGYRALLNFFCARDLTRLSRALEAFSFIISIAATFISLYLIDRFSEGYWIFGLFFCTTLSKLLNFGKYNIFGE